LEIASLETTSSSRKLMWGPPTNDDEDISTPLIISVMSYHMTRTCCTERHHKSTRKLIKIRRSFKYLQNRRWCNPHA
jgi:hypothetical protein